MGTSEATGVGLNLIATYRLKVFLDPFLMWAFHGLFLAFFLVHCVRLQLINMRIVNGDRKSERRRKSMHCSITR